MNQRHAATSSRSTSGWRSATLSKVIAAPEGWRRQKTPRRPHEAQTRPPAAENITPLERRITATHASRSQALFIKRYVELTH